MKLTDWLVIPVQMVEYVVKNRMQTAFTLYAYMLIERKDKFRTKDLRGLHDVFGLKSQRSIQNALKLLLKMNWIGQNPRSKIYHVRSINRVSNMIGVEYKRSVVMQIPDYKSIDEFLTATLVANLVDRQRRGLMPGNGRFLERPNPLPKHLDPFSPVSSKSMSECYGIPISTAKSWKEKVKDSPFVKIRRNQEVTNLSIAELQLLRKYFPEESRCLRIWKGLVVKFLPDKVRHYMKFKTKKRLFLKSMFWLLCLKEYTQGICVSFFPFFY